MTGLSPQRGSLFFNLVTGKFGSLSCNTCLHELYTAASVRSIRNLLLKKNIPRKEGC